MDELLVDRAQQLSAEHLRNLPTRFEHVQGVAATAANVVSTLDSTNTAEVVAAAWLHDIGYAPQVRRTGFHPLDGAEFVRDAGFPDLVVSLVAHHTGAMMEATERGLSDQLKGIPQPPSDLLDLLTFADMTTGPDGTPVSADDRLREILARYDSLDPVYQAVCRSGPELLATVARVQKRLANA